MHEEGKVAYEMVKTGFDKKGFLRLLRNNYLYHYPNDKNMEKAFKATPEDEPWEWISHRLTPVPSIFLVSLYWAMRS
jgi:hypothetical protein